MRVPLPPDTDCAGVEPEASSKGSPVMLASQGTYRVAPKPREEVKAGS